MWPFCYIAAATARSVGGTGGGGGGGGYAKTAVLHFRWL